VVTQHDEVQRPIDGGHPGRSPIFVVRLERDGFASRERVRVVLRGSRALHVGVERELRVNVRVAPEDLAERVEIRAAAKLIGGRRSIVFAAADGCNGERESNERSKEGTGHRANLTEAADIAIDGLDLDFA
jgi:hypothetical protein